VVKQIDGPALLVGHSYAGAVISNVSRKASKAEVDAIIEADGY
jgi:hypothetical protein